MKLINLLLVFIYVVDASAQSQWEYKPLWGEENFYNRASDAKIQWVSSSDKGEFIEYSVNADETCRNNLMGIFSAVSSPSRARTNILYVKILRESTDEIHFLVDQLNRHQ